MSEIRHTTFSVPRTAHCYQLGPTGGTARELWIACHGYGQLAKHFIRRFDAVADEHRLVVAPQGLSLFYTKGLGEAPGASWMTREERLSEIADYSTWLQMVYGHFTGLCQPGVRIVLFGFSQGCATIMRWLTRCRPHFDELMLWAGLTPEDIDYRPFRAWFAERRLWMAFSMTDPFVTPERLQWQRDFARLQGLPFRELSYEGGHQVTREGLKQWLALRTE